VNPKCAARAMFDAERKVRCSLRRFVSAHGTSTLRLSARFKLKLYRDRPRSNSAYSGCVTSTFSIRTAHAHELPLLAPLELRAAERFRDSVHAYAIDLPAFDPEELAELHRAGTVWVAVAAEEALLGFALGGWLGTEPYLHELDVEPAHGRRGVGRALVRRVAAWAREAGGQSLLLSTFSDVPWNAPYYARLGFELVPLEDYSPTMRARRQSDGVAGMPVASRVMMRAGLERLLG
jgi:GNAT superfamily N-acetyltransferase